MKKIVIRDLFNKNLTEIPYKIYELAQFLHGLRVLIKSSHCICLLTIPSDFPTKLNNLIIKFSDLAIKIE